MWAPSGTAFAPPLGLNPKEDIAARAAAARASDANLEKRLTQLVFGAPEDPASEFTVVLDRTTGRNLGASVSPQDGVTLEIEAVVGELFQQWNEDHPELAVRRGDRIVEANGVRGDASRLLEQCRQSAVLVLVVRRGQFSEFVETFKALIERHVDARVHDLRAWGTRAARQMSRRVKEATAVLSEEVALCREAQARLEAENDQLKKVLLFLTGRLQALGAQISSMTTAGPRAPSAPAAAAEPAAAARTAADPSPTPPAGVAQAASQHQAAPSPPRRRAASPQDGPPKLPDVPAFPFPGPAAGTAPLPLAPPQQRAPSTPTAPPRHPAAAPGREAATATFGQAALAVVCPLDGCSLGLEPSRARRAEGRAAGGQHAREQPLARPGRGAAGARRGGAAAAAGHRPRAAGAGEGRRPPRCPQRRGGGAAEGAAAAPPQAPPEATQPEVVITRA